MHYTSIIKEDLANGPGIRTTLFVSGCDHHCKNCFNPETWDYNAGYEWDHHKERTFIEIASRPFITGISILGGDPLCIKDESILNLIQKYKSINPMKTVWIWTGYTFEELIKNRTSVRYDINVSIPESLKQDRIWNRILGYTDVLVDGEFKEELKDPSLKWRGSSNQRLIDVTPSIKHKKVFLVNEELVN